MPGIIVVPSLWRRSNFVTGAGWILAEAKRTERRVFPARAHAKICVHAAASPSPQITLHFHANIWWNWHLAIFLSYVRSQTLFILIGLRLYLVSRCPYEIRVSRYKTVDYSRTLVIGYESYPMEIGRWFLSSAVRTVRVNTVSSIYGINSSIDSWRRRDLETWQLADCKRSSSQSVPLREN